MECLKKVLSCRYAILPTNTGPQILDQSDSIAIKQFPSYSQVKTANHMRQHQFETRILLISQISRQLQSSQSYHLGPTTRHSPPKRLGQLQGSQTETTRDNVESGRMSLLLDKHCQPLICLFKFECLLSFNEISLIQKAPIRVGLTILDSSNLYWNMSYLPFYRVGSLLGRVFTRPIITYFKSIHIANQEGSLRLLSPEFVRLGHYYHGLEQSLNERFKVDKTSEGLQALSDQIALERGIDFFYEIVIYSLLIFFSLIEVELLYRKGNYRKGEINIRLEQIRIKTAILKETIQKIEKEVNSISQNYKEEIYQMQSKLHHLEDQNRFNNYIVNERTKNIKKRSSYESLMCNMRETHFRAGMQRLLMM